MITKKILIVGGVAGGASTAARLRRLNENHEIILLEKGEHISFANCGLPYYIGGTIKTRSNLLVQTVEGMSSKFNIDVRNFNEVVKIDKHNKVLTIKKIKTNEFYTETYDILVLSPGANPIKPPIPGINEATNLFTLRNIPDTDAIKNFVDLNKPKHAVVIGGGFIGLEMAENLVELGIQVTIVEMSKQVMAPLDYEMACIVHDHLLDKNIDLILEDGVSAFAEQGKNIVLSSGKIISTDFIIFSIGVQPETKIAIDAGIEVNQRKAIVVNSQMQTSDPYIYALGDAVEVKDYINGNATMIPLAWPANRQASIVANHISGLDVKYNGTLGSSVAKVFDLTVATTGNNEKLLKNLNLDYQVLHIHPGSHAGYYPGAFPISLKLIFDISNGKILGAQAVGFEGVEKRIDVIATAIKGRLSVLDLPDLELCYAPPYSSAKDPVNMAGYVASNLMNKFLETIQWHEVDKLVDKNEFFLDVREPFEAELGSIKHAINIPLGELRNNLNQLPKEKDIYTFCQVGLRGYIACRLLTQLGYKCKNLDGGYKTYALVKGINGDKGEKIWHTNQTTNSKTSTENSNVALSLNACGLQCPGPIRRVFEEIENLKVGQILEVFATDPGFTKDIATWCNKTGNVLLRGEYLKDTKQFVALIQKSNPLNNKNMNSKTNTNDSKNGATLVVFSGDLDKAIAAFIIATGAASMGKKVTMFFTFWGINILKRKNKPSVEKDSLAKMFDFMLPKNTENLSLSKMNMAGMGPKMIKHIMKKKNVDDIDTLIKNAIEMGVEVVACSMSMDLMGIKKEELLAGVKFAGVATYLGATDDSGLNLFI